MFAPIMLNDEFYGFTNQEIKVITKLIHNNDVTISFCIDNNLFTFVPACNSNSYWVTDGPI